MALLSNSSGFLWLDLRQTSEKKQYDFGFANKNSASSVLLRATLRF